MNELTEFLETFPGLFCTICKLIHRRGLDLYPHGTSRGYLCFKVRWRRRLCLRVSVFPSSGEGAATRLEALFSRGSPRPPHTQRRPTFAREPYIGLQYDYFSGEKYSKLCWGFTSKSFEQAWKIFSIKTRCENGSYVPSKFWWQSSINALVPRDSQALHSLLNEIWKLFNHSSSKLTKVWTGTVVGNREISKIFSLTNMTMPKNDGKRKKN